MFVSQTENRAPGSSPAKRYAESLADRFSDGCISRITLAGDDYNTVLKHYARFAPDYLAGVHSPVASCLSAGTGLQLGTAP